MPDAEPAETPASLGYRMPAEWEPHATTWLAWPHRRSDWPGKFAPIPWVYAEIVRALVDHEPVNLIVRGPKHNVRVWDWLNRAGANRPYFPRHAGGVKFWELPTDRSWVRDSGPIFVVNEKGEKAVLDWHFNAWAKYPDWTRDDRIPRFVAEQHGLRRWQPTCRGWRVVLEGGSIDVNGQGLMLTTEECLLSKVQDRNPPLDRADYEQLFDAYESASGRAVDPDVVRWWEILGTLKWGIMCILQAFTHLSGTVRSVELAAIGRRVCENEWDLLELIG